jgi:hypothetical protein
MRDVFRVLEDRLRTFDRTVAKFPGDAVPSHCEMLDD